MEREEKEELLEQNQSTFQETAKATKWRLNICSSHHLQIPEGNNLPLSNNTKQSMITSIFRLTLLIIKDGGLFFPPEIV